MPSTATTWARSRSSPIGATGALSPLSPPTFSAGASPTAIRIDPAGHFAYVTRGGSGAGTIAQLAIGASGTLSSLSPATATVEADPQALAVDGSGGLVYVAGGSSNSISMFNIIPTSGALAPNQLPRVAGQVSPSSVAIVSGDAPVQATPKFAYVANNGDDSLSLYTIGASGALTAMSPLSVGGTGPQALATDPSNHHLYVANGTDSSLSQYTIGPDGKLVALNPDRVDAGIRSRGDCVSPIGAVRLRGQYFGRHSVSQYAAAADGALTALTPASIVVSTSDGPSGIVVDPTGRYVFVSITTGNVARFSVGSDGTLSPLSPATVAAGMNSNAVVVSPSGTSLFVGNSSSNNISQYAIGAGGTLSPLGPVAVAYRDVPGGNGDRSERALALFVATPAAPTLACSRSAIAARLRRSLRRVSPSAQPTSTSEQGSPSTLRVTTSTSPTPSIRPASVWQFTIGTIGQPHADDAAIGAGQRGGRSPSRSPGRYQ